MTTPINPASPPTWPLTLTGPSDGEAATSSTVNGPFQSLIDASESARLINYGQTRRYMSVDNAGNLSVGPLVAVTLKVGGVWQTYTNSVPLTKALAGLVVNTLYNVYVYYSAGLQLQVSLDPVDDYRLYKDGDEGYAFVGYVMTNFAANTVPARFNGTTYTYTVSSSTGFGVNGNTVLDQGNSIGVVAVLLPCMPSYAQELVLQARAVRVGALGSFTILSEVGDVLSEVGPTTSFSLEVPVYATPQVSYAVPAGTDTLTLWVSSFTI